MSCAGCVAHAVSLRGEGGVRAAVFACDGRLCCVCIAARPSGGVRTQGANRALSVRSARSNTLRDSERPRAIESS